MRSGGAGTWRWPMIYDYGVLPVGICGFFCLLWWAGLAVVSLIW